MAASELVAAGDIGTFRGGSGFPTRFQGGKTGDLPFFKVSDMNNPGNELFMRRANHYVSESERKAMGAVRIPSRAIVFAKVGAAVFLERKRILVRDSCIDNNMAAFIVDERRLDVRFAHYLFCAFKLSSLVSTTALPSLNGGQLRSIPLLVPKDLSEQRRIAAALANADQLIGTLQRLIAKKRAISQGMMQQLLTGRTRLPGFSKPWPMRSLGSMGTFIKGRGIRRDDVRRSGIPCIRYGEIYTTYRGYTSRTVSFVSQQVADTALPLRCGDLLFAGSGETRDEIGLCVAYTGNRSAVAGGDIVVLRGSGFNPVFLSSAVNTPRAANQKSRLGQGDAVVHISSSALASVELHVPPLVEQDAIAKVIVDSDLELSALNQRLAKAQAIKKGMMQQLLSGRAWLPVESTS